MADVFHVRRPRIDDDSDSVDIFALAWRADITPSTVCSYWAIFKPNFLFSSSKRTWNDLNVKLFCML